MTSARAADDSRGRHSIRDSKRFGRHRSVSGITADICHAAPRRCHATAGGFAGRGGDGLVPPNTGEARGFNRNAGGGECCYGICRHIDRRLGAGKWRTLACTTWPLCDGGTILPFGQGQLAVINMVHRLSVAAMSVALLILILQVNRHRSEPLIKRIAFGAAFAHAIQIMAGALFVLSSAGREWGAIHVGLAAAVWGLLVMLVIMEGMNRQQVEIETR